MTPEIITKQFKRGMTVEQIAALHGLDVKQVEVITKNVDVERTIGEQYTPRKKKWGKTRINIDFKEVERLLREEMTLPKVAEAIGVNYHTLRQRIDGKADLRRLAAEASNKEKSRRMTEVRAAKQEVAVATEVDGFSERYTIAQLSKEELEMTEAIAEARNTAKDKWVHYVAHQIDNARIKTKFDVVEQDGKLIKQTEVRFVIEEEMR